MKIDIVKKIYKYTIAWLVLIGLCFSFVRLLPGGSFQYELPLSHLSQADLSVFDIKNESFIKGLSIYYFKIFQGDLGHSALYEGKKISDVIWPSLKLTIGLSLLSFFLICTVVLFTLKFSWQNVVLRKYIHRIFKFGLQIPLIVWAPTLIYLFTSKWSVFPTAFLMSAESYILPIFVLSVRSIFHGYLLLDKALVEIEKQDVIRFARAKGLSANQIFYRHIFRLILPQYMTFFLPTMAGLLSGSLIVEFLFAIPGMGMLFQKAFEFRDLLLVSAICLITGTYYLGLKFTADILLVFFEPREIYK